MVFRIPLRKCQDVSLSLQRSAAAQEQPELRRVLMKQLQIYEVRYPEATSNRHTRAPLELSFTRRPNGTVASSPKRSSASQARSPLFRSRNHMAVLKNYYSSRNLSREAAKRTERALHPALSPLLKSSGNLRARDALSGYSVILQNSRINRIVAEVRKDGTECKQSRNIRLGVQSPLHMRTLEPLAPAPVHRHMVMPAVAARYRQILSGRCGTAATGGCKGRRNGCNKSVLVERRCSPHNAQQ